MGLSFRKSIKAGPFRFNLSGSGIGVSVGVPGFRVGTGPRGNYISMSAGGFTYRKSLGPFGGGESAIPESMPVPQAQSGARPGEQYIPSGSATVAPMKVIESADVRLLSDTDSASLVDEINNKRSKVAVWYFPLIFLVVLWWCFLGANDSPSPVLTGAMMLLSIVTTIGTFWLYMWDEARRSTVLFYDFDQEAEQVYERVVNAFGVMSSCRSAWRVIASGQVLDGRYNAGAGHTIKRTNASLGKGGISHLQCNIDVPVLHAGRNSFYFYPDRIFIVGGAHVAVCKYESLSMSTRPTRFIEDSPVPSDSQVVGHTWRFVNKNGTPDRRFKDNRQLPIAQYEELHLTSAQGVRELYHLSKVGTAEVFVYSVLQLIEYQTRLGYRRAS